MNPRGLAASFMEAGWGGRLGEEANRVYLSPQLLRRFGLRPGVPLILKIGSHRYPVKISGIHSTGGKVEPMVFVSPDIAQNCQIPNGRYLTIKYTAGSRVLAIGPIIGLFTVRSAFAESLYGAQEPVLAALIRESARLCGFVFLFCPEDVDWAKALVTGHVPVPNPETGQFTWLPLNMPIPDVVYDRIPTRSFESRPAVQETKSRLLTEYGLPYFNPRFLDKWETHVLLQDNSAVARYLPPTQMVESCQDIAAFLHRYSTVFLKPSAGSLGRRIIKIQAAENGHYKFMYRSRDRQTKVGIAPDFTALAEVIRYVLGSRKFVVQKDLRLARFKNSPFDIRVLAQKDRKGNWRRTKIYVRKAAAESFLSNLSDGGQPQPIAPVLKEVFHQDFLAKDGLGEKIREAVRLIPQALETATGMTWGELGIDLGLDLSGNVWLIEINSKPFRTLVSQGGSFKIIERSLMRPLEFSKRLAGFYRQ